MIDTKHLPESAIVPSWWNVGLLFVCLAAYCWLFNWSERINNPNEMARVHTVVALAEHGTYAIARRTIDASGQLRDVGPVRARLGIVHDVSLVCDDPRARPPGCRGTIYAAKAPGVSLIGVAPYLVQTTLWQVFSGAEPSRAATVWWLRLWCVTLPTVLAWCWLAHFLTARLDRPRVGLATVLAGALGSLSLTYGQMFAGHQAAALALLLVFACVVYAGSRGSVGWVLAAGFGSGAAAAIEYPASLAAAILLLWLLARRRRLRDAAWLALGAALPLGLLLHFHTVAFGAPWRLPYGFLEHPSFSVAQERGIYGVTLPSWESIAGSLVSPYTGLYFFAPWMLLAWLGAFLVVRRAAAPGAVNGPFWLDRRSEGWIASVICIYFLWLQCSYGVWRGGWVVGPRHLTGMVPFAVIATAHALDAAPARLRHLCIDLLAILGPTSILVTGMSSAVSQGFPEEFYNPISEVVLPLLRSGYVAANPLMLLGVPGPWSATPYFLSLAIGAVWLVILLDPRKRVPPGFGQRAVNCASVLALSIALALAMSQVGEGRTPAGDRALARLAGDWWPAAPPGSRAPVPLSSGAR